MPRKTSHLPPPPHGPAPSATSWSTRLQSLQVQSVDDVLAVFNRYVGAVSQARDFKGIAEAQRAAFGDWIACVEQIQARYAALARAVPAPMLAVSGWRLKRAARDAAAPEDAAPPLDLFEQSKLGLELLMRPWVEAPDLDHTDEFVA